MLRTHDMKNGRRPSVRRAGRIVFMGTVGALGVAGCISPDSPLVKGGSEGCPEFKPGQAVDSNLAVDPTVRAFMSAASDFTAVAESVKASVLEACSNIAKDLGAQDTWSSISDKNQQIANGSGTGACDAAGQKIEALLIDAGKINATVALAVSRGECHVDFDQQAKCDTDCSVNAACDPVTPETRCEPGRLSEMCSASCQAGAFCVGSEEHPANCMGKCESTCVGQCKGTCIFKDGRKSDNEANCQGKCTSSCNGTCKGTCKVEADVTCGASVRCTGGCTGTFTDPVCTTEYGPPDCTENTQCHEACSARAVAEAKCDPPTVTICADIVVDPALDPLVKTLEANLPKLIQAAETQGKIGADAVHRLATTGDQIAGNLPNLDGKSLSCLGSAVQSVGDSVGKFDVAVQASVNVNVKVTEHAQ